MAPVDGAGSKLTQSKLSAWSVQQLVHISAFQGQRSRRSSSQQVKKCSYFKYRYIRRRLYKQKSTPHISRKGRDMSTLFKAASIHLKPSIDGPSIDQNDHGDKCCRNSGAYSYYCCGALQCCGVENRCAINSQENRNITAEPATIFLISISILSTTKSGASVYREISSSKNA